MMEDEDRAAASPETLAAQAIGRIDAATGAVTPGLVPATTFVRDADYAPRQDYIYARDGGPNVEHAEAVCAEIEGAAACLGFASGMAAFVALCEILEPGDRVAAPSVIYHGSLAWLRRLVARRGIGLDLFEAGEPGALERALCPGATRLLWIETPTNPTWDVIDIARAAEAARDAGALLAVDCTVAPAAFTRPLDLGADVSFQSGTKYLGGHSDLTAGILGFRERGGLVDEMRAIRTLMGSVLGPWPAWMMIRGMRTLFLRWEKASANAMAVAEAMQSHPLVERVLYPGLPSHPGHAVAARQMGGRFGGMVSLLVRGGFDTARRVATATRIFLPATSLGGVESLIEHRRAVEGPQSRVPDNLLRLSVGVEAAADLVADLRQALDRAT
jgi:cystathionine gamma-synthase